MLLCLSGLVFRRSGAPRDAKPGKVAEWLLKFKLDSMKTLLYTGIFLVSALLLAACGSGNSAEEEDELLAKVYNKSLYLSELEGMFPEGTTASDSSLIINAYVNRWVREALILYEAERNIPKDLNIDKLVRDYRASLIRANYERILVEELLDSVITQAELIDFYQKNKSQYQLETPIIRCYFVKVPTPVPESGNLRNWWNNPSSGDNYDKLVTYCNTYAVAHHLEDSTWHKVEDIGMLLPTGTLTTNNISTKREFTQRDGEFQYFFKLFEVKNRKEIAPLSFIEDQARKVILHKRKIKLLEDKKEQMYEMELRKNNIIVYTN